MFSKALFKQSCKANGTMWFIVTFATCFMLAAVMLISGNGNIGEVKNSIQDTIITKEVDSQMQKRGAVALSGSLTRQKKTPNQEKVECFLLLWYNNFANNKSLKARILYHVFKFCASKNALRIRN